ncbi:hypothetical protein, partial [Streptomyces sp. NPDC001508]|uniref:hypothetical protein n=1 Tax=Streptomyces sp. NPDC001508 TaxID=3154656 RepID=UPI0033186C5D
RDPSLAAHQFLKVGGVDPARPDLQDLQTGLAAATAAASEAARTVRRPSGCIRGLLKKIGVQIVAPSSGAAPPAEIVGGEGLRPRHIPDELP